jgi:hypothetical protein
MMEKTDIVCTLKGTLKGDLMEPSHALIFQPEILFLETCPLLEFWKFENALSRSWRTLFAK